jgi:proteic killer suppression protein
MKDIFDIKLSGKARRDLKRVPLAIAIKLGAWIEDVGHRGLFEVRKIRGYHDEPLKGKRKGQRSIRLNAAYRAIYIIEGNDFIRFVEIQEVNKHAY